MTTILTLTNPFSRVTVELDITGLTEAELSAYAQMMDDEIREAIHDDLAPCTPEVFLAAYVERVGADEAGKLILGS